MKNRCLKDKVAHYIAVLLIVFVCILICPQRACAADVVASGTCGAEGDGGNLTWTLDSDGVLTISGEGSMEEYTWNAFPWYSYKNTVSRLIVEDNVTSISASAFSGYSNLVSISLGKNISVIGDATFWGCTSLASIEFNATRVEDLMDNSSVFYNCGQSGNGITVVFGNDVTAIPAYLFYVNSDYSYPKVISISIPDSVNAIGQYAFANCGSLTSITIPSSITSISPGMLYGCGLSSISLPDSITSIGNSAFSRCKNLTELIIPGSVTSIGILAFDSCTQITSVTIPENVTSIGRAAFSNCPKLTEVLFNAINIDMDNFNYADINFHPDVFRDSGTTGDGVVIQIGSNVAYFSNTIFCGAKVQAYRVNEDNRRFKVKDRILYNATEKILIACPNTFYGQLNIPENVKTIREYAFCNCTKINNIVIGSSVSSIGDGAFRGCTGLSDISLPEGIAQIGNQLFYNCDNLSTVEIPEGVTSIGANAFSNCVNLTTITIPEGVTSIGQMSFYNCAKLTTVVIPESVTSICSVAFWDCTSLTEIRYYAEHVVTSFSGAFTGAGSLGDGITVTFGKNVAVIPDNLFNAGSSYPNIKTVVFLGDMPTYGYTNQTASFYYRTFTAYYPYSNTTWNNKPSLGVGNSITWVPYSLGVPVQLSIVSPPTKVSYTRGEEIDLSGLTYSVEFTDGCVESHTADELDSVSYDFSTIGTRLVTITYRGVSNTLNVTVGTIETFITDSSTYPESPHPYLSNMNESYEYSYPGANSLSVTFSNDTMLEFDVDYLYIYDNSGSLIGTYTDNQAAGLILEIPGDSFSVRLSSDESDEYYGFAIDSIQVQAFVDHCVGAHTPADPIHENEVAPTETTDGSYDLVTYCSVCGAKISREQVVVPALGYVINLKFSHSCSFENNITLNYYAPAAALEGFSNFRLAIEKQVFNADGSSFTWQEYNLTDCVDKTNGGTAYKVFPFANIASMEMGDEVRAILYAEKNGNTYSSPVDVYSVKEYAYNRLMRSTDDNFKRLLVDMLNYGAAAQTKFNYNTSHLVNEDLRDEDLPYATSVMPDLVSVDNKIPTDGATAHFYGKTVVFESNVELKYYMTFDSGTPADTVKLVLTYTGIDGIAYNKTIPASEFVYNTDYSAYGAKITTIASLDMGCTVTAKIYDGETLISETVEYSIETYAYNRLNKSTDEIFKDLLRAMMKYGKSAENYFINRS